MTARERNVTEVSSYLREHFPNARIGSSTDGLTANEVFTITEGGASRFVELTKRLLEGDDAGIAVAAAIREWDLARAVASLAPNGTLRVAATGVERVS